MEFSLQILRIGALLLIRPSQGRVINSDKNYLEEAIVYSHVYREPGCPIVSERAGLNKEKVYVNASMNIPYDK